MLGRLNPFARKRREEEEGFDSILQSDSDSDGHKSEEDEQSVFSKLNPFARKRRNKHALKRGVGADKEVESNSTEKFHLLFFSARTHTSSI